MPRSQNVARPGTCSTRTASYTMPSAATVQPTLAIATGQNHTSGTRASANHSAAPTSTGGSSRTASTAARLSSAFEPTHGRRAKMEQNGVIRPNRASSGHGSR